MTVEQLICQSQPNSCSSGLCMLQNPCRRGFKEKPTRYLQEANFVLVDARPWRRHRASHQETWSCKHPVGELQGRHPCFQKIQDRITGFVGKMGPFGSMENPWVVGPTDTEGGSLDRGPGGTLDAWPLLLSPADGWQVSSHPSPLPVPPAALAGGRECCQGVCMAKPKKPSTGRIKIVQTALQPPAWS